MDFSQLNSAEQAHMSKVIEKKQVRRTWTSVANEQAIAETYLILLDARLYADVLEPGRPLLQRLL